MKVKDTNRKWLRKTPWYCDGFTKPLMSRHGWYEAMFGMVYWDGFRFSWATPGVLHHSDYVSWRGIAR